VGGAGWKFGFHTPKPNFRFLSKGGFPEQTLEIFWFDSEWVYALSSTLGNGAKNFMSYTQVSHPAVTYANRGAVWYRNNFTTLRSNAVAGRWEGPTVVLPDNEVLIYKQNKWSEVSTWGPGTPGSEGYAVARFMPRIHGFGNEGGGMLPNVLNVLAIEAGRRDVGHPEIVRFQETYFYAGYGDDKFGLIRFELWSSQPELCVNGGGRYPGIVCNGHMVRYGMVAPNHFKRLPDYTEGAQASATAFFNAAMAARPLNDPKLKKRAILDRNRPAMRGGFQFQGAGSDSFGAAGPGEWILLENTVSDADWYFHPSTQWTCREGYKYLGSLAVKASVDDRGVPTLGDHWIILCGTDDDVRLELTCPAGFSTRAWFPAGLGARTTSGTDVTNAATFMNFCVRNSQCVGACYPSTAP